MPSGLGPHWESHHPAQKDHNLTCRRCCSGILLRQNCQKQQIQIEFWRAFSRASPVKSPSRDVAFRLVLQHGKCRGQQKAKNLHLLLASKPDGTHHQTFISKFLVKCSTRLCVRQCFSFFAAPIFSSSFPTAAFCLPH
jgi:hypothetical protein